MFDGGWVRVCAGTRRSNGFKARAASSSASCLPNLNALAAAGRPRV